MRHACPADIQNITSFDRCHGQHSWCKLSILFHPQSWVCCLGHPLGLEERSGGQESCVLIVKLGIRTPGKLYLRNAGVLASTGGRSRWNQKACSMDQVLWPVINPAVGSWHLGPDWSGISMSLVAECSTPMKSWPLWGACLQGLLLTSACVVSSALV